MAQDRSSGHRRPRRRPSGGAFDRPGSLLSARETSTLLRLVQTHQKQLEHAHSDAKRFASAGVRPAYLIDYQMIYWYMFEIVDSPQDVMMLEYLFELKDTDFILGPGTILELDAYLRTSARYELLPDITLSNPSVLDLRAIWSGIKLAFEQIQHSGSDLVFAWNRLRDLLERSNFHHYAEDLSDIDKESLLPDRDALSTIRGALQSARDGRQAQNNADALNFASVVTLRKLANRGLITYFPYLLTATPALLNESHWSFDPMEEWGLPTGISCSPDSALYSEVLLTTYPATADSAADHSRELSHRANELLYGLRRSEAYREMVPDELPPLALSDIDKIDVSSDSRDLLHSIVDFFNDPVVQEAQRITQNVDHSAANWARQALAAQESLSSTRKFLDLLASILRALDDTRSPVRVSELWSSVIERVDYVTHESVVAVYRDIDRPNSSEYLRVEHHHSDTGPYLAVSWPCHVSLDDILAQFSKSFARHDIVEVELLVGTREGGTLVFDAKLPLLFEDLNEGLQNEGAATWIRLRGGIFDLYCDISGPVRADPVAGVVGAHLNVGHMAEVYHGTSARNLSSSWLQTIMDNALSTVNHAHAHQD